ncbi:hypothetical protein QKC54_gp0071 [Megavirus baoshan]|uniref:Uncharacterized protein n=1 Tax=Megavirus baoshan TaxID=2496520 RepID=A0A3S5HLF5_9VIRU|nr:hypothetical protein QKC54_gp0071 [Megavirus baoshan]AZL89836.1 hypothetical protein Mb1001 [Megavirus baoshan]
MASWLCASNQNNRINESVLTDKIKTLNVNTSDLIAQAIVITCECKSNWDTAGVCICDTIPLDQVECVDQVECLDFVKIVRELTDGGIISIESVRDMYDYISYMLFDEDTFVFPPEWKYTGAGRDILVSGSFNDYGLQSRNIRGFCFYSDELTFIKPLIVTYLCDRNPVIFFSD